MLCFLCHVFGTRGAQQRPKPLLRATCSCSRCCTASNSTRLLWYDKCRLCLVELRSVCSRCSSQLCGGMRSMRAEKKKAAQSCIIKLYNTLYTRRAKKFGSNNGPFNYKLQGASLRPYGLAAPRRPNAMQRGRCVIDWR